MLFLLQDYQYADLKPTAQLYQKRYKKNLEEFYQYTSINNVNDKDKKSYLKKYLDLLREKSYIQSYNFTKNKYKDEIIYIRPTLDLVTLIKYKNQENLKRKSYRIPLF